MSEQKNKINLSLDFSDDNFIATQFLKEESEENPNEIGQLSADVAETETEIIVLCPMAGTTPKNLELHLHNDLLTIKGERYSNIPSGAYYHHKECYFGKFSRSIVMPTDVKVENANAEYRNGLLTIRIPKAKSDINIPVYIVEE
ncbi:MAG TPA: Hsp20/alpha crystallin family protein [Candidatus Magasanikbacteria bacterium]|nr:Hsp20/alpha crystallin family protein [Candidatus Magasanikbacteria bacterium]